MNIEQFINDIHAYRIKHNFSHDPTLVDVNVVDDDIVFKFSSRLDAEHSNIMYINALSSYVQAVKKVDVNELFEHLSVQHYCNTLVAAYYTVSAKLKHTTKYTVSVQLSSIVYTVNATSDEEALEIAKSKAINSMKSNSNVDYIKNIKIL